VALSAEQWIASFEAAAEALEERVERVDGLQYTWTGPLPIRLNGIWVAGDGGEQGEHQGCGTFFQPDPIEFAALLYSPMWMPGSASVSWDGSLFLSGGPPDCQVIVTGDGTGGFTTKCADVDCGPFEVCHPDQDPATWCDCTGVTPPQEPMTCHGTATLISTTTVQLDCTGSCTSGVCRYTSAYDPPFFLAWCECQ
jgi:hypothetical protein